MRTLNAPASVDAAVAKVADIVATRRSVVLTGAGISTDSGIPDYRGEGSRQRNPMTFQDFLGAVENRQRYWAGSQAGWARFGHATPNEGHRVLARLEKRRFVNGVITQNVDGLHTRAGSHRVVDLHGSMNQIRCLGCGRLFARAGIAARIDALNPRRQDDPDLTLAPDGDAEVAPAVGFVVPDCDVCGGILKPDVVFFGELVPAETFRAASDLIADAGALLVAGSSLVVNSGIRLLEQARRRDLPIVIINRGPTAADARATVKLDAGTSETLTAIEAQVLSRL